MSTTLAATALLMGLATGPHCAAMCGAACGAITGHGGQPGGAQPVQWQGRAPAGVLAKAPPSVWSFQLGRLVGYSAAGAAAATLVQSFAWLSSNTAALRPLWMVFHLAVLAWGLMLLVLARQPDWVQRAGLATWGRVRPLVQRPGGVFAAGALWTLMPCGMLYSALLVASLSGHALQGAFSMALFAIASSLGLLLGPQLLQMLRTAGNRFGEDMGTRIAGLLLAATAAWALWMDLAERIAIWCQ